MVSEPGSGSRFIFTINVAHGSGETGNAKDAKTDDAPRDRDCFQGLSLLLAEDIEINREIVMALLDGMGIDFTCVESGSQAVKAFAESPERYDLILMDIKMPEMDGYEATRRIRALNIPRAATVPIIAMTANVYREDIERARAAGMNDHVGKPLDVDELIGKMREHIAK